MIKEYWIEALRAIEEFSQLGSTEDAELVLLKSEIDNLVDDQFIATANEQGIARREAMLSVQPFYDDTLETRRFRIATRFGSTLPYTYRQLEARLITLGGPDSYEIILDSGLYTLQVLINLGNPRMLADAVTVVNSMVPANLSVTVSLRYNRHSDLANYTHSELSALTHKQIREEPLP